MKIGKVIKICSKKTLKVEIILHKNIKKYKKIFSYKKKYLINYFYTFVKKNNLIQFSFCKKISKNKSAYLFKIIK